MTGQKETVQPTDTIEQRTTAQIGEKSTFAKLFAKRKRVPRLAETCEVETRARPFKACVVEPYIDIADCTYCVLDSESKVARAINKYATELFTDCAYDLKETNRAGRCDDSDSEDSDSDCGRGRCGGGRIKKGEDEKKKSEFSTLLNLPMGVHETTWNGRRVVLLRQQHGKPEGTFHGVKTKESMVLFVEGRGNGRFIQEFAEFFLKKLQQPPKEQHFQIYRWSHDCGYWRQTSYEKARVMNSVILPHGMRESVEADMERFLSGPTKAWYGKRGIPYKRCYMFWGVPGTGKTSLITALAGRFRRKVCFLSAHHPKFTDEALKTSLSQVPSRSIVVLEDIDSLFSADRSTNNQNNPLTFTGLLNGLDGIGEHTGTIFIMTTNFIDRLDKALIRAGRVDMKVEFKRADDDQLTSMFEWFYDQTPELATKLGPSFVAEVRKKFPMGVTMAEMQQHFIDNMFNDAQTAVKNVTHYDLPLMQRLLLGKPGAQKKSSLDKEKKGGSDDESSDKLSKPKMRRTQSR